MRSVAVRFGLFLCALCASCHRTSGAAVPPSKPLPLRTSWVTANFHAHTHPDVVKDDGSDSPLQLHQAMRDRGISFSVHSIHSVFRGTSALIFLRQKTTEEALHIPGVTVSVGEELTVANGPNFKKSRTTWGIRIPGNLNHVSLIGVHTYIPDGISLNKACTEIHRQGGICIVNHPGPGRMMWEDGLWEQASHRNLIDGLEVYNGMAMAGFGKHFEERYLEASAYSGLGMHVAPIASADTHGPQSVKNARDRLGALKGPAEWLGQIPPLPKKDRPELDAYTLVLAPTAKTADIVQGVKQRKTIALYDMAGIHIECPNLGDVLHTGHVTLDIQLSSPLDELSLYKEGRHVHTWTNTSQASFRDEVTEKTAYVFIGTRGQGRFTTSAIWYEP